MDVRADVDEDAHVKGQATSFAVGRLLADEIRRFDVADWNDEPYDVADSDSPGLEAAYASLLDENGQFLSEEFDAVGDSIVYLYRFRLHDEFIDWRLAVLDAFRRQFSNNALVLAQLHTTWFSEAEFDLLGFRRLPRAKFRASAELPGIDRDIEFMVRDNTQQAKFGIGDYPTEYRTTNASPEEWLESNGPWEGLM